MKYSSRMTRITIIGMVTLLILYGGNPGSITSISAHPKLTFSQEFGSSGSGPGQFLGPYDVAVSDTHIFVADWGNYRIQKLDLKGTYVSQFGSFGSGNGQFDNRIGIHINETHLFASDSGNNRIQIFDHSGTYLGQFGSSGSGNGQFSSPWDVEDNSTHLFVTDSGNYRVQIFDMSGNYIDQFGSGPGTGDGQFNTIYQLALNGTHIFVTDLNNDRIQVFDSSLNFQYKFGNSSSLPEPYSLELDQDLLIVGEWSGHKLQILNLDGTNVASFGSFGNGSGEFNVIAGFDFNGTHIIVTDRDNNRIQILDYDRGIETFTQTDTETTTATSIETTTTTAASVETFTETVPENTITIIQDRNITITETSSNDGVVGFPYYGISVISVLIIRSIAIRKLNRP